MVKPLTKIQRARAQAKARKINAEISDEDIKRALQMIERALMQSPKGLLPKIGSPISRQQKKIRDKLSPGALGGRKKPRRSKT